MTTRSVGSASPMVQALGRPFRKPSIVSLACVLFVVESIASTTLPTTKFLPVTPGEEKTRSQPFIAWYEDLSERGYTELEYVISGTASIYTYADTAAPEVEVQKADLPYATRALVRRPSSAEDFNGTVFLEVLNATAGWDGDPIWQSTHEYIMREGAAWVGLTTKPVTVHFLREGWGNPPYPERNTKRYSELSMPQFGQVWDMLTQTGALLKTQDIEANPLNGFEVERLIMVGYSQSVAYQVTYANSFHADARMPDGAPVYDGYYLAAGGANAKHVSGPTDAAPETLPDGDMRNLVRVKAPVIRFQTQTEVIGFGAHSVRQSEENFPLLRFYELVGGSHVDAHLDFVGGKALVRDLGLPPSFCPTPELPLNPINIGYAQSALLDALDRWIASDSEPPASRLMKLASNDGEKILALGQHGNAKGGVRPPEIQVPLGTYSGWNEGPGFCRLFGSFERFDDAELRKRYGNRRNYMDQLEEAVERSMDEGFLLRGDSEALIESIEGSGLDFGR